MPKELKFMSLIALALAVALAGGPAWGVQGDKELDVEAKKIDKAAASADSSWVAARIVEEWSGTDFRFDAASDPRPLTAQDVENLRAKGLGYGEISVLLALTANQPNPDTAKPLGEVLAARQSGKGWGEVSRELGYKNLGSVLKSVQAMEKGVAALGKPESGGRPAAAGKPEKMERSPKPEGLERPGRVHKLEIDRPPRVERSGEMGRPGKK